MPRSRPYPPKPEAPEEPINNPCTRCPWAHQCAADNKRMMVDARRHVYHVHRSPGLPFMRNGFPLRLDLPGAWFPCDIDHPLFTEWRSHQPAHRTRAAQMAMKM